jgi:hypothetical protein
MSLHIFWDDTNPTLLHCQFSSTWNCNDFERATNEINRLLEQRDDDVVIVVDVPSGDTPPVSILSYLRSLLEMARDQIAALMIVSIDALLLSMMQLVESFYAHFGVRLVHVENTLQARALVDEIYA